MTGRCSAPGPSTPAAGAWLLGVVVVAALAGAVARAGGPRHLRALVGLALGWSRGDRRRAGARRRTRPTTGTAPPAPTTAAAWVDAHLQPGPDLPGSQRGGHSQSRSALCRPGQSRVRAQHRPPVRWQLAGRAACGAGHLAARALPSPTSLAAALAGTRFREVARYGDYVIYAPESS